ncbi:2-keto-4-pentenoate hydratase [Oryzisolibacter propanilivorax]|uniref:2-keto-4-pentenoate hydratase n=1 Tax=Oryzisolibacter propanilivorax TaxID=1527607 RepID=A0A1G9SNB4_9BURK|nr:fumarylacetoacetate hydrolase [Oryzisolibacter propanilivorax]SDM36958.1 2-keto-4-pentenoate hydratase [Oryzisolibacter propanilivorax]
MLPKSFLAPIALALGLAGAVHAQCLDDAQVAELAARYAARQPAADFAAPLSDADGACTRQRLNALLATRLGRVVGYKAGLTNPAVQKRFNTDQPVWGVLYEGMIQPSGFSTPVAFGARPLYEADMLVRVKDSGIHHARTPAEVLRHIDQVIPFIELPDLIVQTPSRLNGAGVAAINVGARLGVAGEPIAVPVTRGERYRLLDALQRMQVQLTNGQGQLLAEGRGSDILEHPLNAVVWIAQALQKDGITLQPGDLVSLGSFSPLLPPRAGLQVTATYLGLPGAQPVRVSFE